MVLAIGSFHKPNIPKLRKLFPKKIYQIHSAEYRNSKQLPKGAILVVGSGNSGVQIAEDLNSSGRKVYLCVGKLRILPRRYRGKDCITWMDEMGKLDTTVEDLPSPDAKNVIPPLLYGNKSDVDLRKLAKEGVILLGRLIKAEDNKIILANDLNKNLKKGDETLEAFKKLVDDFIKDHKIKAPEEKAKPVSGQKVGSPVEIDFKKANITSVIWATGFQDDYSWIKLPFLDKNGEPVHTRGVTKIPGFYLLGLRWLHKYKSFFIYGVGEDAFYLADQIALR